MAAATVEGHIRPTEGGTMNTRPGRRTTTAATALAVVATTWTGAALAAAPAAAGPSACGIRLLPTLDTSGANRGGEVLAFAGDGLAVGGSQDASGTQRATYWVDGIAHGVPVDLVDGELLDVNDAHVAVGDGYDAGADRYRGFVADLDTGAVTWLPGIGGDWAGARRVNEAGVAVGDGTTANGFAHPLRWSPPYATAVRLPRVGGSADGSSAWAAGVNNRGDAVGSTVRGRLTRDRRDYGGIDSREHAGDLDPVAWTPKVLNLQEAGPAAHAFNVNDARRAVGFADVDAIQTTVAAYWSLDDRKLHRMGEPVPGMWSSVALGVSDGGWATGSVQMPNEEFAERHAFVWTGTGDLLMLPTLEGDWDATTSNAHAVSDARDQVGGMLWVGDRSAPAIWGCASVIGKVAS